MEASHVLRDECAGDAPAGAVRFPLSRETTIGEIDQLLRALSGIVARLRAGRSQSCGQCPSNQS
ncbi:hypothetical protein [Bradyrhizobium retamae]|uniref:Uncharacterized protein n=1 Tax=Bradyrhizobium retamae TaxID=1300035 RepID=A0A0R3NHD0_9BRAD|nr:hypothetical protein [Bradyrhizobium retamae]KRR29637.1 hypothetical protein CQ13_38305 [Bradyrhizobium retamae]